MVIALIGDSCTGKSTIADCLKQKLDAELYSGRDYLRLAKSESAAAALFRKKLEDAFGDGAMIYVISEKEHLALLPEKCVRVLITARLESIQRRFAQRMNGKLPPPVAVMLERKYGQFESEPHDLRLDTETLSPEEAAAAILRILPETNSF